MQHPILNERIIELQSMIKDCEAVLRSLQSAEAPAGTSCTLTVSIPHKKAPVASTITTRDELLIAEFYTLLRNKYARQLHNCRVLKARLNPTEDK